MSEEFEAPETIYAINLMGLEFHFDRDNFKEIESWMRRISAQIIEEGEEMRFCRMTTETIYGEEITFSFADVYAMWVSTPETRRRCRLVAKALKDEKISQGFLEDDE